MGPQPHEPGRDGDPGLLSFEGLEKSYREGDREHVVLRGATARIERGELVAVVGPSGSGKSTLLNLVSGIDVPDAGRVWVEGRRLTEMSERDRTLFRRRHIGFIFQFYNLLPTLTVTENLLLPVELKGRVPERARERASALLERVGLADRGDSFPDRLSGGEQQRVAAARALIHEPTLVLADEPTGNLDAAAGARLMDLLEELVRDAGLTLVLVTHNREQAGRADRILRIRGGRLVPDADEPAAR